VRTFFFIARRHKATEKSEKGKYMNVIVIIADSFRADHLGCYGNSWIKTPCLDKFAAESARFNFCIPENVPTVPARVTWFTGQYGFPFRGWKHLEPSDRTLAEFLWDKGYTSAMITDTFHFHKPGMNINRGFDYTQFIRGQEDDPHIIDDSIPVDLEKFHKEDGRDEKWTRQTEKYLRNRAHWKSEEDHFIAQMMRGGLNWLDSQNRDDNMFLWLDCFDPHEPWDPPQEYVDLYDPGYEGKEIINPIAREVEGYLTPEELNHIKALYAGEITLVDKWIGYFIEQLRERGFLDDSLIIFTSDHGEPLGEHGIVRKCRSWLFEELMRTPLIIHAPNQKPVVSDAITQSPDLMPTILDFLKIDPPDGLEGESLMPIVGGQEKIIRENAYCGMFNQGWSIRNAKWNFVYYLRDQKPAGSVCPDRRELYDLKNDPGEQTNVIEQHPQLAKDMELELLRFVEELKEKRRG